MTATAHAHLTGLEIADSSLLSPRESEVVYWSALGKSNDEIALILDISAETVKTHLKNSFTKLHVCNRAALVTESFRVGILRFGTLPLALLSHLNLETGDRHSHQARRPRAARRRR